MPADIIIRDAAIFDGSGGEPFQGDVAVERDRIASVGEATGGADREIIATGLAVAPGFIDVHTHDDFAALVHPDMAFKVLGGVTTSVVGNCGFGAAPYSEGQLIARTFHPHGEFPEYEGYLGYLAYLDEMPASVNIAPLAGHGTIRMAAMGNEGREPDDREMAQMIAAVEEGRDAGVFGLSSGLIYEPGRHAGTEELVELASVLRGTTACYASHIRDEGDDLLAAVTEAIHIGETAGVPVQLSHHKVTGRHNWGLVETTLGMITAARTRGVKVHIDQYPYTAGSTILSAVLDNLMLGSDGAGVVIAASDGHPEWEGRSLDDLAAELGTDGPEATGRRILESAPTTSVIIHSMCEDDVQRVLSEPETMIGSDGIPTLGSKPHPRLRNTFARVLGHYARDVGTIGMGEAVHRMTGLTADVMGLTDRGHIREGGFADLVIFDPATIIDRGTFTEPELMPSGIQHVMVNGVEVVDGEQHLGSRPGRALRRVD